MKLSIIIPVFNEEKTIGEVLSRLIALQLPWQKEIVVVDDGSKDRTKREILKALKTPRMVTRPPAGEAGRGSSEVEKSVKIINHKSNQGKGAAIRTGIKQANGDFILIHDADLEYNPDEIPKLLKALKTPERWPNGLLSGGGIGHEAVAVYGSRFMYKNVEIPKAYFIGNKFLTWLTNICYGTRLTDMETCYKLIPNNIKWDTLTCNSFDIEPEITIHLIKNKIPIIEVPIKYFSRSRKAGKKLTFRDAFSAIKVIVGKLLPSN